LFTGWALYLSGLGGLSSGASKWVVNSKDLGAGKIRVIRGPAQDNRELIKDNGKKIEGDLEDNNGRTRDSSQRNDVTKVSDFANNEAEVDFRRAA